MRLLAITGCPSGVAHTHMAAAALQKAGKKVGVEIKVEKQGALGIENKITEKDVEEADVLIIAADLAITGSERFKNIETLKFSVSDGVKKPDELIKAAIEAAGGE